MIIPENKKGLLNQLFDVLTKQRPGVFERSPEALTWMVHHPGVDVETKVSANFQKRSWRISTSVGLLFYPEGQESDVRVGLRTYLHRLDPQNFPALNLLAHEHEIDDVASRLQTGLEVIQQLQVYLTDPSWVIGQLLKDGEVFSQGLHQLRKGGLPFRDHMVFVSSSSSQPYRRAFALCLLLPIEEGLQMQHKIKQQFLKHIGKDPDTLKWWQTTTERWDLMEDTGNQHSSQEGL